MKQRIKAFQGIFLLLSVVFDPVLAADEIGLEIVDTCRSEQKAMAGDATASVRYGLCLGYLKGVADSLDGHTFCLPEQPDTARMTQLLRQVYLTYVGRYPARLEASARYTVIPAFAQAFPCKR